MKELFKNMAKIEKFSKKIFYYIFSLGTLTLIFGYILLYNFNTFSQMFLARHIIETAYNLFVISVFSSLCTDIYIKKAKTNV